MKYKHDGPKIPKPISTTWAINGTIPDDNPPPPEDGVQRYWSANFSVGVEAPTAEEAIAIVKKQFPSAFINGCQNRGAIHFKP